MFQQWTDSFNVEELMAVLERISSSVVVSKAELAAKVYFCFIVFIAYSKKKFKHLSDNISTNERSTDGLTIL
jgi:hypothetical protein